jgi:hypothetical protein
LFKTLVVAKDAGDELDEADGEEGEEGEESFVEEVLLVPCAASPALGMGLCRRMRPSCAVLTMSLPCRS